MHTYLKHIDYNQVYHFNKPQQYHYNISRPEDGSKPKGAFGKQKIMDCQSAIVNRFMKQYDSLMKETIRKNNQNVYSHLYQFLAPDGTSIGNGPVSFKANDGSIKRGLPVRGVGGKGFQHLENPSFASSDSQVPTCLVITSNESSSSIDTQFATMCSELQQNIGAINLILDEKKCGNFKQAVEHIQIKLREALGITWQAQVAAEDQNDDEKDESGDEVHINIKQVADDGDEEMADDNVDLNKMNMDESSRHVSTILDPSTIEEKHPDAQFDEATSGGMTKEAILRKRYSEKIIRTRHQKQESKRLGGRENTIAFEMEKEKIQSDILQKETFYGVKNILQNQEVQDRPVLLIIKNIKTFNVDVLNSLIHVLKKFRGPEHLLNLNLMLGMQSNSKEDIHLRVTIQNCLKLSIKTFWFPSMKNIIFEVVYKLLCSKSNIFTFEPKVIATLIEQMNLFGMSAEKFSRILRALIADHIYADTDFFFVHIVPLSLCSKKEFHAIYKPQLERALERGFEEIFNWNSKEEIEKNTQFAIEKTYDYIVARRHWHKALEVLEELVSVHYEMMERQQFEKSEDLEFKLSEKDLRIFKYQFVLNYLSKNSLSDKMKYINSIFKANPKWEHTFCHCLPEILNQKKLKHRIENQVVQKRTSKFMQTELELVGQMLSGEYRLMQIEKRDSKMKMGSTSATRKEALLSKGLSSQAADGKSGMSEANREQLMAQYKPTNDVQFQECFYEWMQAFHQKYLCASLKHFQCSSFLIRHGEFDTKISPDIGGAMTASIVDSTQILLASQPDDPHLKTIANYVKQQRSEFKRAEDLGGIDEVSFREEGSTVLMAMMKFYGRDVNVMDLYYAFKAIWNKEKPVIKKSAFEEDRKAAQVTEPQVKELFTKALYELKYMGFISQTRQSSFVFRKNYFGKARHQKVIQKTDEQKEAERLAIQNQFGL